MTNYIMLDHFDRWGSELTYNIVEDKHDGSDPPSLWAAKDQLPDVADVPHFGVTEAESPKYQGSILVKYCIQNGGDYASYPPQLTVSGGKTHDGEANVFRKEQCRSLGP